MIPHAFAKIGKGEGKLLMLFQPAGKMEAFFNAISEGGPSKMSKEQQDVFRREHGIVWVGPALTNLKRLVKPQVTDLKKASKLAIVEPDFLSDILR